MEDLSLAELNFSDAVMDDHVAFYVKPNRWTSLSKSVADAGTALPKGQYHEVKAAWVAALRALPNTDKTIVENDLERRPAASNTWFDIVTPRRCMGTDPDHATLARLRNLLAGVWGDTLYTQEPFVSVVELLVPDDKAARPYRVILASVLSVLRNDVVPAKLSRYVPPAKSPDEASRCMRGTEEERFTSCSRNAGICTRTYVLPSLC